ncbi:DNA-binding protein [Coxiella burnetii]|nr:DNA-binding protein [Coxiella burnetii]
MALKEQGIHLTPKQGWVRTLRKALGLTIKQLAKRLSVDPSRAVKIETSEVKGAVTLRTLQSVAEALNCTFVYSFVPKTSLEDTVRNQARKVAKAQMERTAHTMELENQAIEKKWFEEQVEDLTDELLRKSWKHFWE